MFHVIAAAILGSRNKNGTSHQDRVQKHDDEPLRKDEKIIGRIVLFIFVFTLILVLGVIGSLK